MTTQIRLRTHTKNWFTMTGVGLCASEVDRILIHHDVISRKEVVAMVQFVSMFRYHITRLQTKQTTSGPQVTITE